jgi:hypothetical protein
MGLTLLLLIPEKCGAAPCAGLSMSVAAFDFEQFSAKSLLKVELEREMRPILSMVAAVNGEMVTSA